MKELFDKIEEEYSLPEGSILGKDRTHPLPDVRASVYMCLSKSHYTPTQSCNILKRHRTIQYSYKKRFEYLAFDKKLSEIYNTVRNLYIALS